MVLNEIVPRGRKPIFFDDSNEFEVPGTDIPDRDAMKILLERNRVKEELYQENLRLVQSSIFLYGQFQAGEQPTNCLLVIPNELAVAVDVWDDDPGIWTYNAIRWGSQVYWMIPTSVLNFDNNIGTITEALMTYVMLQYAPLYVDTSRIWTLAEVKAKLDLLHNSTYRENLNQIRMSAIVELGWFPGEFPITPYYHMVFWQGHSFYIPDRFEINEYFSRRSDAYLVCEPINPILKLRGTSGSIGLNNLDSQKTHSGVVKSLQGIYESLDTIGRDVNTRAENLSQRKRFGKKTSSIKRRPTIEHPIDYRSGKPTVYRSEPIEQKQPMVDMEFVKKFRLIKILKYNVAAYGRNIDYPPDGAGDLPNIYEVSSKDDTNIINIIRILESIDQMGILDLKSFVGV